MAVMAMSKVEHDVQNRNHQQRVADLACTIARGMGFPESQSCGIRMAALLHDIGKMWLRPEVLGKTTQLTDIEFGIIRAHPETGYNICRAMELPLEIARTVLQHHERMDGSGYPQGLSGREILPGARIMAVADVVEAMVSQRPYRPAHSIDEALAEIAQNRGLLYDADVVDACLELHAVGRSTSPNRDDK